MTPRSNRPEVRNPVLALPAMAKVMALPVEQRAVLHSLISDIRREARARAAQSLARNKHMVYAYWAVVAVYAGHLARALQRGGERRHETRRPANARRRSWSEHFRLKPQSLR